MLGCALHHFAPLNQHVDYFLIKLRAKRPLVFMTDDRIVAGDIHISSQKQGSLYHSTHNHNSPSISLASHYATLDLS